MTNSTNKIIKVLVVDPGQVTNTLDALSSVAKLSVSMTMLMSSGGPVYKRPLTPDDTSLTLLEDQIYDITSHVIPSRIESLPNIRKGGAGSTPATVKRQVFSSKVSRKYAVSTDERRRHMTGPAESMTSTCSLNNPGALLSPGKNPENNCGIEIVIDGSSDMELNVSGSTPASGVANSMQQQQQQQQQQQPQHPPCRSQTMSDSLTLDDDSRAVISSNSQMFLLTDM